MTVAFAVGEGVLVNHSAFAGRSFCRIASLEYAGQGIATIVSDIRQGRCANFRCTGYSTATVGWHVKVVVFYCVGVCPVVTVAFAVGEGVLVNHSAFAGRCFCRIASLEYAGQGIATIVSDIRQGRCANFRCTGYSTATVGWHVKVVVFYCVGVCPVVTVAFAVGEGVLVNHSAFAGRCFCRIASLEYAGQGIAACIGDIRQCRCTNFRCTGYSTATIGWHVKVVVFYCIGICPVVTVAFAVGKGIHVNHSAFTGRCFCRITSLEYAGQGIATSIGNLWQGRCANFRCTGYSTATVGWHVKVVVFYCVGVCPVVTVAFAVGEGERMSPCAFTAVVGTANNCIARSNCIATVVVDSRWRWLGCGRDARNCAAAVGRHRKVVALYCVGVDPVVMVALAVGISECVGSCTLATVVGATNYCRTRCNCIATVVVDNRWGWLSSCRYARYCAAAVGRHREVVALYCVGVDPVVMVALAVSVGKCICPCTLAAVVGTTNYCIARCNCIATVVINCRWCWLGCCRDARYCAATVGRNRKVVALYRVGVNPVVMIAFTVGVGECIGPCTLTAVVSATLYRIAWCNCSATVVINSRRRWLGSCRDARCCAAAVGRH